MHDIHVILADLPGLGRIRLCECNSIHVSIGPITIHLEQTAFQQMADLTAAASERLAKIRESNDEQKGVLKILRPALSQMTH